jgi:cytidylate kinase
MASQVVAISHSAGAGGRDVGTIVAERLGFRYVDEGIIALAAEKAGSSPAIVADAERRRSLVDRILGALEFAGPADASVYGQGMIFEQMKQRDMPALIREVIFEVADRGRVVIVSHGASVPLGRRPDVLRVLVTASVDIRARRVAEAHGLDDAQARKRVAEEDDARAQFFRRFYDVDREVPTQYDLVVNTDALSPADAAELVLAAVPMIASPG